MEKGADPTIICRGNNALDAALKWGHLDLADIYLGLGVIPNSYEKHPYYRAFVNKDQRNLKRYKKFERSKHFGSAFHIPLSYRQDLINEESFSLQSGILTYEDDYLLAARSKGILLGPVVYSNGDFGWESSLFHQFAIIEYALVYRQSFGKRKSSFFEPRIGLSLGPLASLSFGRRVFMKGKDRMSNSSLNLKLLWTSLHSIERKRRKQYYKSTRIQITDHNIMYEGMCLSISHLSTSKLDHELCPPGRL